MHIKINLLEAIAAGAPAQTKTEFLASIKAATAKLKGITVKNVSAVDATKASLTLTYTAASGTIVTAILKLAPAERAKHYTITSMEVMARNTQGAESAWKKPSTADFRTGALSTIMRGVKEAMETRGSKRILGQQMGGGAIPNTGMPIKLSMAEKHAFTKAVREKLKKHGLTVKAALRQKAYGTQYVIETPNSTSMSVDVLLYLYPEENRIAAYSLPKKPYDAAGKRPKPTKHPLGAPQLDDEAAITKMVGKVKRFHEKLENPRKPTKVFVQEAKESAAGRKQPSSFLSVEAEVLRLQEERDNLVKQYDLKIQKLLDRRNPLKQK